jgi:tRNA A37 N6-isopentenylltransferase MiaA
MSAKVVPVGTLGREHPSLSQRVADELRRATAGAVSHTARQIMGLDEVTRLPPGDAIAALALRTRRFAAYQRKWMRRIPGLVTVDADRAPDDVAADILEMARARQRLLARRAG